MSLLLVLVSASMVALVVAEVSQRREVLRSRALDTMLRARRQTDDVLAEEKKVRTVVDIRSVVNKLWRNKGQVKAWDDLVVRAGWKVAGVDAVTFVFLSAVVLGLLGVMVWGLATGVFLGLGFAVGVRLYAGHCADRRSREFGQQLPGALDMLSNCLRSGHSLLQAIDFVAREMPSPMGDELERVKREVRVDIPLDKALAGVLERITCPDFDLVVTAIAIHKEVGGNLTEIFDRITSTIRGRVKLQGHIRSLTAQGRMSGLIIGSLPIAMMVLLWMVDPEYMMPLFTTVAGRVMLIAGLCMQVMGAIIIKKMIRIEV